MSWAIALIVGGVSISAIFGYLGVKLDKENWPLKLLFLLFAVINLWGLIALGTHIASINTTGTTATQITNLLDRIYNLLLWGGIIIITWFTINILYKGLKSMQMKKGEDDEVPV
jgi:hypothetical protein